MTKKIYIPLFCASILTAALCVPAYADTGSITVDYSTDHHSNAVDGAEFTAVQILNYDNGEYSPVYRDSISIDDVLDKTEETAKRISKNISKNDGISMETINGIARFDSLDDGVWLICQTGKEGDAEKYEDAAPSLVQIPENGDGGVSYDVTVYPKTVEKPEEPEEPSATPSPEASGTPAGAAENQAGGEITPASTKESSGNVFTGDYTTLAGWAVCMAVSIICTVTAYIIQRRRKR